VTDDAIDQIFGGLDFYPGSKRKRREMIVNTPRREQEPAGSWEERSFIKTLYGREIPMYTIGSLAQALNKSEKSIRLWIARGYFPIAVYRMPDVEGSDGVKRAGRRLYSKDMIDAAVEAFERRGLLDAARIEWSQHADLGPEIAAAWNRIKEELANNP